MSLFFVRIENESELQDAAEQLLREFADGKIFCLHGEMGAGKTTFIKAICRVLGVKDTMSSPTFSLVNEYRAAGDLQVFHFDFYRLRSEHEAEEAGLHELLASGAFCFVEWPDKAPGIIPEDAIKVCISVDNGIRTITAG